MNCKHDTSIGSTMISFGLSCSSPGYCKLVLTSCLCEDLEGMRAPYRSALWVFLPVGRNPYSLSTRDLLYVRDQHFSWSLLFSSCSEGLTQGYMHGKCCTTELHTSVLCAGFFFKICCLYISFENALSLFHILILIPSIITFSCFLVTLLVCLFQPLWVKLRHYAGGLSG